MKDNKINEELFKSFCESYLNTTKLFKEGSHSFEHHSKLIGTSNNMPNIKVEGATRRRFTGYTHMSKFTENEKKVNEDEKCYLVDKELPLIIEKSDALLNAWFDIIANKAYLWLKGEQIEETQNFKDTKKIVMDTNDIFKDFIDSNLIKTDNENNRIGKDEMRTLFLKMYPDKHLTVHQIMTSMKEKGIMYSPQNRCNGMQGCYMFVKTKVNNKDKSFFYEDDKQSIDTVSEIEVENNEMKLRIQALEQEILELKKTQIIKEKLPIVKNNKPVIKNKNKNKIVDTPKTETVSKKGVLSESELEKLKVKIDDDFIGCEEADDIFDDLEF